MDRAGFCGFEINQGAILSHQDIGGMIRRPRRQVVRGRRLHFGHMPWRTTTPMEELIRFVTLAQTERFTLTELCKQFGISRKTTSNGFSQSAMKTWSPTRVSSWRAPIQRGQAEKCKIHLREQDGTAEIATTWRASYELSSRGRFTTSSIEGITGGIYLPMPGRRRLSSGPCVKQSNFTVGGCTPMW